MTDHLKILILEDSSSDAELMQRELRKADFDFEVKVVDKKEEFIEGLKNFSPGVILSDHTLPQFNSLEALRIFKIAEMKIPFILVTGSVSEEFAVQAIHEGADDYILKDRMARLPDAILKALEKCRLQNERQKNLDWVIANQILLKEAEKLAHLGSWSADPVSNEIKWSDEAFRIYGYELGEVIPSIEFFLKYVHPEDVHFVKQILDHALEYHDSKKFDFRIIDRNGITKYISSEIVIKRNLNGEPIYLAGFNQDITDIRVAEESLKKSEANLRTVFENSDTGYILLDTDMNLIAYNNLALQWGIRDLKATLKEGVNYISLMKEDRKKIVSDTINDVLKGCKADFDISYPQAVGPTRWYNVRMNRIQNKEDMNLGVCILVSDNTERKNAELERDKMTADLSRRNKDLEQFSYIISHDLRAPVAVILGITDLATKTELDKSEIAKIMSALYKSTDRLDGIIKDLNQILQLNQTLKEQKTLISFSKLVTDIKESIGDTIEKEKVTILTDFTELDTLFSLKSYLYSIFYNFISNSIKYRRCDVPCSIEIRSKKLVDGIKLTFKDNGLGIDLEKAGSKLFGLYNRFHPEIEGKGMGLFMVKSQIEMLHGKINVKSEVGKGTEFSIEFKNVPEQATEHNPDIPLPHLSQIDKVNLSLKTS